MLITSVLVTVIVKEDIITCLKVLKNMCIEIQNRIIEHRKQAHSYN